MVEAVGRLAIPAKAALGLEQVDLASKTVIISKHQTSKKPLDPVVFPFLYKGHFPSEVSHELAH